MDTATRIIIGLAIMTLAFGLASKRIAYLLRLLLTARPDPGRFRQVPKNLKYELTKVLGQKKLLQWTIPGAAHALTFWGFLVIQITLIETLGEMFSRTFQIPIVGDHAWLGFMEDLFIVLVPVALLTFAIIRIVQSPKRLGRRSRFFSSHLWQAFGILFMIFLVVATLAMARGARSALGALPYPNNWAFVSNWLGDFFSSWTKSSLHYLEDGFVLAHIAVVFSFLVIVVNSKHMHIFTSPLNVLFGRQPIALGRLRPLEIDMENMTDETVFGVGKV
jgi:hypothetical protein